MAASMDDDGYKSDDLYALLNVDREASTQDINKAFRRMSKLFHPDRFVDPAKKKSAEVQFNKLKNAHEILCDPNKRQIYNHSGMEGLKMEGLELINRIKSPAEIIAELDRLKYEKEERELRKTNPKGEIEVSINATNIFEGYSPEPEFQQGLPSAEISEYHITQTVDYPMTKNDTAIISGMVSSKNGNGSGKLTVGYRRTYPNRNMWLEGVLHFGQGIAYGLTCFKHLTRRIYCKCGIGLNVHERGIAPGLNLSLTCQLDRHIVGEMMLTLALRQSSLSTTVNYDKDDNKVSFSVQVGAHNLARVIYVRNFADHDCKLRIALTSGGLGSYLAYGCQKKISEFSTLHAKMLIGTSGGAHLRIRLVRGQQAYSFPIHLSEQVLPTSVFYGTFIPCIAYFAAKKLIIDPYLKQQESEELERKREKQADELRQKRKDAEVAVELMTQTVEKSLEYEEKRNGLIILKALYGRLVTQDGELIETECINVRIPLQALVVESQLILTDASSKCDLPGFYDPCPGQDKSLYIRYNFRNRPHQVTLSDKDPVRIPLQKHFMRDETEESFVKL